QVPASTSPLSAPSVPGRSAHGSLLGGIPASRTFASSMNRMKIGEVINPELAKYGKPLEGVRILAIEQMQALPFATQLLARLGADVVKVEHPVEGESGRGAQPAMIDPNGKRAGATFLRNALDKRSLGVDLTHPKGRELVLALAPHFDIVCENFKA